MMQKRRQKKHNQLNRVSISIELHAVLARISGKRQKNTRRQKCQRVPYLDQV
jgi:hypothetical protein